MLRSAVAVAHSAMRWRRASELFCYRGFGTALRSSSLCTFSPSLQSGSPCALHVRFKCSVAALSAFALRCGTAKISQAFGIPSALQAASQEPRVFQRYRGEFRPLFDSRKVGDSMARFGWSPFCMQRQCRLAALAAVRLFHRATSISFGNIPKTSITQRILRCIDRKAKVRQH